MTNAGLFGYTLESIIYSFRNINLTNMEYTSPNMLDLMLYIFAVNISQNCLQYVHLYLGNMNLLQMTDIQRVTLSQYIQTIYNQFFSLNIKTDKDTEETIIN